MEGKRRLTKKLNLKSINRSLSTMRNLNKLINYFQLNFFADCSITPFNRSNHQQKKID